MKTPTRLALFGAGLAIVFGSAFMAGGALIPHHVASSWTQEVNARHPSQGAGTEPVRGVSLSAGDLMLGALTAPAAIGSSGVLSFRIQTVAGVPVTKFDTEDTKKLHLIVVRSDGTEFRHVHPTMNDDGQWSIPWRWDAAGPYRIFADFVPSAGALAGKNTVLSATINVEGTVTPHRPWTPSAVSRVDGFTVTVDGSLAAGTASTLTTTITRDGQPVDVQPYLGTYGHLVILREGDLAYLHAHPQDAEPTAISAQRAGKISFMAEPPTPGRYLLYLDFQVDGEMHTAQFVVDALTTHQ